MIGPAETSSSLCEVIMKGSFLQWQTVTPYACGISLKAETCGLQVQDWFIVACLCNLVGFAGLVWFSVFYTIKTNPKINLIKCRNI